MSAEASSELFSNAYAAERAVEQRFVDRAYCRLDEMRERYRRSQQEIHARHGVGNAQGWTERDAIAAHLGDMATRLEHVEDRLVFGRLDSTDGHIRYIGRTALSEDNASPLLIDWRAPAARPFYQATGLDKQGVVRRRHILTQARTVISLEDELLDVDDESAPNLVLQGEGALMSALNQAREGRMGDIVSTIQSEQDAVIRAPGDGLIVLQGGPGTGKTAVALHRAAYLLYSERERLERSGVLVVGPSRVFLRYIEQVLPSLGESGVVSMTLGDLVPGVRAEDHDTEEIALIKGKDAWVKIARTAVRSLQRIPETDQVLNIWNRSVTLTPADVARARTKARRSGKPHNEAREGFALDLIAMLAERIVLNASGEDTRDTLDPDELQMWREEVRSSIDARRAINLAWMPTSSTTLLERLYARPTLLADINKKSGSPLSSHDLHALARPKGSPLTIEDVPILDELEEHLGSFSQFTTSSHQQHSPDRTLDVKRAQEAIWAQNLGDGIVTAEMLAASTHERAPLVPLAEQAAADRTWTYGHIVVDEAQDLSPMAWNALLRRCPSLSFTVVGDLDQRRGHMRPSTWKAALGPAARAYSDEYLLTVSYRTPGELTRLAARVMEAVGAPLLHSLTSVREVEAAYTATRVTSSATSSTPSDDPLRSATQRAINHAVAALDQRVGHGVGRIAVIMGQTRARLWTAYFQARSDIDQRVSVLNASSAKGLEFDHTIVVEPSEILQDGPGDLLVALTRATQHLHILHASSLPEGFPQ